MAWDRHPCKLAYACFRSGRLLFSFCTSPNFRVVSVVTKSVHRTRSNVGVISASKVGVKIPDLGVRLGLRRCCLPLRYCSTGKDSSLGRYKKPSAPTRLFNGTQQANNPHPSVPNRIWNCRSYRLLAGLLHLWQPSLSQCESHASTIPQLLWSNFKSRANPLHDLSVCGTSIS